MSDQKLVCVYCDNIGNFYSAKDFLFELNSRFLEIPEEFRDTATVDHDEGNISFEYYRPKTDEELKEDELKKIRQDKMEFELFKKLKLKYEVK